jgi:hypothetical protein
MDADFGSAVKMLTEYGYNGGNLSEHSYDPDLFITAQNRELAGFVIENSADKYLTRCLLNRFYYSDAKVRYKKRFSDASDSDALYFDNPEFAEAFKNKDYESLPAFMAAAALALDERFSQTPPPPKEIDSAFSKAMFSDSLEAAKKSGNRSLISYAVTSIDVANIISGFRARRLALTAEALSEELFDGGKVQKKKYTDILYPETKRFLEHFEKTPYLDLVYELNETDDLSKFVSKADELILSVLYEKDGGVTSCFPFIRYFMEKTLEFKAVKLILTCVKNGLRDELAKRAGVYLNE